MVKTLKKLCKGPKKNIGKMWFTQLVDKRIFKYFSLKAAVILSFI